MTNEAQSQWFTEERRHVSEVVRIIAKWPEYRSHFAYALLGSAVATCDSLGLDVEGWIANLRKEVPRPAVLVPPKAAQS